MIQKNSYIDIVDNTGILISKCIGIFPSRGKYGQPLSITLASVQTALPNSKFKKGMLVKVLLLSTKYVHIRKNGRAIRFSRNLGIVLKDKLVPRGTRFKGVVLHEFRHAKYGRLAVLLHRKL